MAKVTLKREESKFANVTATIVFESQKELDETRECLHDAPCARIAPLYKLWSELDDLEKDC